MKERKKWQMDSKLRRLMEKNNSLINLETSINVDKIIENREIMDNTDEQIINWDSEVSALQIKKVFRDKICKNEKLKVAGKYISFDDDVWDFSEKRIEFQELFKISFMFLKSIRRRCFCTLCIIRYRHFL